MAERQFLTTAARWRGRRAAESLFDHEFLGHQWCGAGGGKDVYDLGIGSGLLAQQKGVQSGQVIKVGRLSGFNQLEDRRLGLHQRLSYVNYVYPSLPLRLCACR